MSLLEIEGLSVRYGATSALDVVSLRVEPGEIVGLIGPSGSGKSTLATAVLGLLPPAARVAGRIRIEGADLATLDEPALEAVRGNRVGMVFQDPAAALNPALTIGRQIGEVLARHAGLSRVAIRNRAVALLARVGLEVPPDRYPHTLSGGQRQRVCVAMAIAAGPALLIADEPTAALDPLARRGIVDLLAGLVRERRMGLLLVSHDLPLVAGVADRLTVLDEGRLVEEGSAVTLLAAPRSPALVAMVSAERRRAPAPPAPPGPPLLAVRGIARSFPASPRLFERRRVAALAGVDLVLAPGETLAVVGASGSGKTTLGRLVLGLDHPDRGTVTIAGRDWRGLHGRALRSARRRVQAVFQDPAASLDPALDVAGIVAEPLALLDGRLSAAARAERVAAALAQVGLPADVGARPPHRLSGGQRQRVALARALVIRPGLIVLDEALSALDPALRAEMTALLRRLQMELGLAYLFISHDMVLVRELATRILVLRDGQVVEQGPAAQVMEQPADPYTAALVAATPSLREVVAARVSRTGSPGPDPTMPA